MTNLIKLQKLATQISARMVRSTIESLDEDIMQSLMQLAVMLDVERAGLVEVGDGSTVARVAYAWYSNGVKQVPRDINLIESFPWAYETLVKRGEVLSIAKLSDFPPEAHVDKKTHELIGTRSILTIPLMIGRRVHHLLTVHDLHNERLWPDDVISLVRLFGEIFVSALRRREVEFILKRSNERLNLAAHAADCGLWELDLDTGSIWITNKIRQHFNFAPDLEVTLPRLLEAVLADDRCLIVKAMEDAERSGDEVILEYRLPGPDGSVRWMVSRGRTVSLGPGKRPRLMGVTLDITQRKSMELELHAKIQEIEQLKHQLEKENEYLRHEAGIQSDQSEILGSCEKMRVIMTQVRQVAKTGSTVLLQGETGTGKGLIAQTVHRLSNRGNRPMIKVNCAALPGALVESELFGREKGAFTGALSKQKGRFELANGSTLFLDEIAEMSLETQAKLLRVLQDGEFERLGSPQTIKVDVRLIAATNRNLEEEVEHGRFRRDLFYRLNVFPIIVPPLRERAEDIPQLVWEFVGEFGERMGKKIRRIASRDMHALQSYSWPGNIRELRNVIEHSLIVSTDDTMQLQRLNARHPGDKQVKSLDDVEKEYIQFVLKTARGRIKGDQGAAGLLGMNPSTLYSRMRKLGIVPERS
jgi:transcriptional regulator with GAF, ATPase, and Fis domain